MRITGKTAAFALRYFFVVAISIAGKSLRDTYFLSRYNKSLLPLMFVACAIGVAVAASAYSRLSKQLSRPALLDAITVVFIAVLLLTHLRPTGWVVPLLYVWVEIVVALTLLQFWMQAADTYDPRQAKRMFGFIGGGGSVAAIVVGTGLKPIAKAFGPGPLMWLVVGSLALSWVLGRHTLRYVHARPRAAAVRATSKRRGFDQYLALIAIVIGLSAIVTQVVDYQFKIIASRSFATEADLVGFFGQFYASTGLASLIVQFFLTGFLLSRFGILAGLLLLPVLLNAGTLAVLFSPTLVSVVIAKFSDQTLRYTLNNSSIELLWLPVPPEKRQWARPFVGGTIKAAAEGLSGVLMFVLTRFMQVQYFSLLALGSILLWIVAAFRLERLYLKTLAFAIERRQIDFEELTLDAQDPAMVSIVNRALNDGDESERLFALSLIEGLPTAPWTASLRNMLQTGSVEVKKKILALAAEENDVIPDEMVAKAISDADLATPEAIRVAGIRGFPAAQTQVLDLLDSTEPQIRAASAASVLEARDGHQEQARAALLGLLDSPDEKSRTAALPHLANHDLLTADRLAMLLRDQSIAVREAALAIAATRADDCYIGPVISCIQDPPTRSTARIALRAFPAPQVVPQIIRALEEYRSHPAGRASIVRALEDFPVPDGIAALLDALNHWDPETVQEAAGALLAVARRQPLPDEILEQVSVRTHAILRHAYYCNRLLKLLPPGPASVLVRDHLEQHIHLSVPAVLMLKALKLPQTPVETVIRIVGSDDVTRLPFVLELVDHILPAAERPPVTALLQKLSVEERDRVGSRYFRDLPDNLELELTRALTSPSIWGSAIALDYLQRAGREDLLEPVDRMYSTLEKTILLKSVSLFRGVPAERLARIAQVAEVTHWSAGDRIIREGDLGDALFIVVVGAVRIEKGGAALAILKKGDCLGEMALLDLAPRSADATATEDSTLLKVSQEDFYDVMSANPEITQAILRILTQRLREADEKLRDRHG